jgi:hypothetical protein
MDKEAIEDALNATVNILYWEVRFLSNLIYALH